MHNTCTIAQVAIESWNALVPLIGALIAAFVYYIVTAYEAIATSDHPVLVCLLAVVMVLYVRYHVRLLQ